MILADPPYAKQEVLAQLAALVAHDLVAPGGRVLFETGLDVVYPAAIAGYTILRRQTYGVAQVIILQREAEA